MPNISFGRIVHMKTVIRRLLTAMLTVGLCAVALTACQNQKNSHNSSQTDAETTAPEAFTTAPEAVTVSENDNRPHYDTRGIYPGDWNATVFVGGRNMIYVEDLEPYADTGVTIEVGFKLEERDYYILAICEALDSWKKLYSVDNSYITGIISDSEAFDSRQIPLYYVCMQSDGCVSFTVPGCKNAGIDYDIQSFTFTLTPEAIKYLLEKDEKSEGIVFQTYGINVQYVLLEAEEIDAKIK